MLTAVYVAFFGMTFTEAVASTKLINVFFLADCQRDFCVAGFDRLQTWVNLSRDNVYRRIHRSAHRHQIKRLVAQANLFKHSFNFSG